MACFHPLDAWQLESGAVVFAERGNVLRPLKLPCGQCVGCRLERSRQWAVRIMHECALYDSSVFVTLTYRDPPLSLNYRDFQLFMKAVRGSKLAYFDVVRWQWLPRFFMCGEYGEQRKRPHFHACLFGLYLNDKEHWKDSPSGFPLYRSKQLEELWPHGFSSFGDVTFDSAAYVARYCMKKVTGRGQTEHYTTLDAASGELVEMVPEFAHMSLKPGIGAGWIDSFSSDVFTSDHVVVNGQKCKPPRYYDRWLKKHDRARLEEIEFKRYQDSLKVSDDASPERLAVREVVTEARLRSKVRTLE